MKNKKSHRYNNIEIIIATKHRKEQAIQKPFEEAFNASLYVPSDFDTDLFGSFTGEVPRALSALDTVIAKAQKAASEYGYDYTIASEGSFGPHPTIFFAPADREILCFIDVAQNIIITESAITTDTNYAQKEITREDEYETFLKNIQFGSHGVMVRSLADNRILAKGITQLYALSSILAEAFKQYPQLRLETDMRAMFNPTRMKVIHELTQKLIHRIKQICDACQAPGFGKKSVEGKLCCKECGCVTDLFQYQVLNCVNCSYQQRHPRPDGLIDASPNHCLNCNP